MLSDFIPSSLPPNWQNDLKYKEEIEKADALVMELNQNCAKLQEQTSLAVATLKQLLCQREVVRQMGSNGV